MAISREEEYAELREIGYSNEAIARRFGIDEPSLLRWLNKNIATAPARRQAAEFRTRCKRGHDLTDPDNVHVTSSGGRRCKLCRSLLERENRQRKKMAASE
jgi:transposase-like protein